MNLFEELGVGKDVIRAIEALGFEKPTPIQEQSIPVLMQGNRDFVGLAQTGTGKTAAFGLPLMHLIDFSLPKTQALILAPTRELCMQITRDIESYSKFTQGAKVVAVYGGASIQTQIGQIKRGAQIIVATPGRLLDLINRRAVNISQIQWVVLDEADEMLNMGFQEDIDLILSNTPKDKQTWLFSATMPTAVRKIAEKFMSNPFELTVGKKNEGASNIEHIYYVVHARDKYAALKRIVDYNPEIFGIIFCRTKLESQEVAEHLIRDGYDADALHGDLSQQQRDKVMKRYRDKSLQLLVATDVAARGIDVNNVTHVINYNLPDEIENYTHRSGRTARAGKSGVSIVIINMKEMGKIRMIERQISKKFTQGKIPEGFDVCEKQLFNLISKVHNVEVNEKGIASYLPRIYEELNDLSKEELIKRFASIEFNRFLEYYRNAPDLNVDMSSKRLDRNDRSDRGEPRERDSFRSELDNANRLFISLGKADGIDVVALLRFINSTAGIEGAKIGRVDLKGVYSFFEVDAGLSDKIINSFKGAEYNGRTVRVELAGAKEGGDSGRTREKYERRDSGSSGSRERSGGYESRGGGYSKSSGSGYGGGGGRSKSSSGYSSGGGRGPGEKRPRRPYK